ncbi:glycosyl transferase, group 1 [hydrothermal vent metagenome]|uniref:Glycosyl transferase, group 1 n=1 Tax=hydrothermal vent metagenome TaxID=652676 RepID=A0A3B0UP94_9ZZZZ
MEGGVGAFTAELAKALHKLGHTVHIITSRKARPADAPRTFSSAWEPIPLEFATLHPRINRWRWPSLAVVADIVQRHDLDMVNIQYQPAAYNMNSAVINFLPWRLKGMTKTAVTFHDLRVPYLFPKAGRLRQTAVNFLARSAHGLITTNPTDYYALKSSIENQKSKIEMIPIGSNITIHPTTQVEVDEIRQKLGLDSGAIALGYFGFLNESKGADTLIETLAQLDGRFHLIFIGGQTGASDSANNQAFLGGLKAQINTLGLEDRVHWTGFLSDEQVSAHLQATDMMVMPYRDGASLRRGTLMAALVHGRPLITTQPAAKELLAGKNCLLVAVGDVTGLGTAVQTLTNDADLRQKIGWGAAQLAAQFSWEKIARETAVFYQTLLLSGNNHH